MQKRLITQEAEATTKMIMDTLSKEMVTLLEDGLGMTDLETKNYFQKLLNFWIWFVCTTIIWLLRDCVLEQKNYQTENIARCMKKMAGRPLPDYVPMKKYQKQSKKN